MRSFIWAIAATLSLAGGSAGTAGAQNATALTLSCAGTVTNTLTNKVEKVRIGVIVNFETNQVIGLGPGWEANIDSVDDTSVDFLWWTLGSMGG
jgi:hypothetical protein